MSRNIVLLMILFFAGFLATGFWAEDKVESMPALLKAAAKGDIELMSTALDSGADPDIKGPMGVTALVFSIRQNNLQAVKLLVNAGATIDRSNAGKDFIQIANETNAQEIADYLTQAREDRAGGVTGG